jgi:hypothetical protein
VAATLVHELTHLANRRALGPALPPWLDEGLADDLATASIGAGGGLDPTALGGSVERAGSGVTYHGPRADLRRLSALAEAGDLPSLSRLTALDWEGFVLPARRDVHYPLAGFFVRFLLAGEGGALREPFRDFLASVAAGESADGPALIRRLDRSWDSLQWSFELWLLGEAAAEAGWIATPPDPQRRRRGARRGRHRSRSQPGSAGEAVAGDTPVGVAQLVERFAAPGARCGRRVVPPGAHPAAGAPAVSGSSSRQASPPSA